MAEENGEAGSKKDKKTKSDFAEVEFEIGDIEFEAKGRSVVVERMFRLLLEKIEDGKLVKTFRLASDEEEEEEEEPEIIETPHEEEVPKPPVDEPVKEEPPIPTEAYLDPPPAWDSLDSESPPKSEPEKEERSPY